MRTALYYPKFEPDQRWFRSILLFLDQIRRIVPPEVEHEDSPATKELIEHIPNALQTVSPNPDEKYVNQINLNRLDKAFAQIPAKSEGRPKKKYGLLLIKRQR